MLDSDKPSPFDFVKNINDKTGNLMDAQPGMEAFYAPFIVNRHYSHFADSVLFANEMNLYPGLDNRMQYDFLYHCLRRRKRFAKWHKRERTDGVELVKRALDCGDAKAMDALAVLTDEQLKELNAWMDDGGVRA